MNNYTSPENAFLMGTGGRSAKFQAEGDIVGGEIVAHKLRQQTSMDGEPLVWEDGNPRMQLVVTVQTTEQEDPDDDGLRNIYIKGQMSQAVAKAVRKAERKGIEDGGKLAVKWIGTDEPKRRGISGAKRYAATYVPPVHSTPVPDDGDDIDPGDMPF